MKVLILADAYCSHALCWASWLVQNSVETYYVSFDQAEVPFGVQFKRVEPVLPNSYLKFLLTTKKLRDLFKKIQPDVLHCFYVTNYAFAGILTGFKPVIITVQGSDLFLEIKKFPFFKMIIKIVLNRASLIHSVANHMTEKIKQYGISNEKIVEFPEGVDTKKFRSDVSFLNNPGLRIISTRNFNPVYNLKFLLDAIPHVIREKPGARFVLIGDGSEKENLIQKAKKLGVYDSIDFLGKLSRKAIPHHLSSSDIYISTSLSDGCSVSLLEAMSCGVFPVVSDIPANKEWIDEGKTGMLFSLANPVDLAEKILAAANDQRLMNAAKEKNFEVIKSRGDVRCIVTKLMRHYKQLIDDYEQLNSKY